jgi:hypothetical protein
MAPPQAAGKTLLKILWGGASALRTLKQRATERAFHLTAILIGADTPERGIRGSSKNIGAKIADAQSQKDSQKQRTHYL